MNRSIGSESDLLAFLLICRALFSTAVTKLEQSVQFNHVTV
ncbi:hypothetical protein [Alkalicoccobacillus plakortidis]|nr:hypothetical protein [Alkalicoccobacillus plakortidis]